MFKGGGDMITPEKNKWVLHQEKKSRLLGVVDAVLLTARQSAKFGDPRAQAAASNIEAFRATLKQTGPTASY